MESSALSDCEGLAAIMFLNVKGVTRSEIHLKLGMLKIDNFCYLL